MTFTSTFNTFNDFDSVNWTPEFLLKTLYTYTYNYINQVKQKLYIVYMFFN